MKRRILDPIWLTPGQCPDVEQGSSSRPQKWVMGLALSLTILLMALTGCNPQPDLVARQLVEEVNSHNLKGTARLFAWDAVVETENSFYFSGHEDIEHWLEGLFADNPVLSMENIEMNGDKVTADYTLTLDDASDLGVTSLTGTGVLKVQFGRITELHFTLSNVSQAELLMAKLKVVGPRLTYTVLPPPLRADSRASLNVFIYNFTDQPVKVESISLFLNDLTTEHIGEIETFPPDNWAMDPGGGVEFSLTSPRDNELLAGEGLKFTLKNIDVNPRPGVWDLEIIEVIKNEDGKSTKSSTTIQLAKFPPLP